ncbi:MAG TPA: phosphoribosylamine--glycine ligase [Polyangia bacterium]
MRVLLVGGGGREHALAWGLARSPSVSALLCAPGNVGIAQVARCVPIGVGEIAKLADLADAEEIDLVVIGPEAPLVAGLSDLLVARGRAVFGCSRAAAELEGSKAFAKAFMARHQVPTAGFGTFGELGEAELFVDHLTEHGDRKLVVKADGLAAGKGVAICAGAREAKVELARLLRDRALGEAGRRVVIEEFLDGREASLMALVDGEKVVPLAPAEDHKTIFDSDEGPMTGGMGAISPTPVLDERAVAQAVREVLEPTARGMAKEGRPFRGLLYAGLMMTASGPKVLEFNCRFGDPETQVVVPRLDEDLAALLHAAATGALPDRIHFSHRSAVCVVMAARGYPGAVEAGQPIDGLKDAAALPDTMVFQAGTRSDGDRIVAAGGRVLGVTALGDTLEDARARAYAAVATIHFDGAQVRRDIGARRHT